jgi:hypothetical protein
MEQVGKVARLNTSSFCLGETVGPLTIGQLLVVTLAQSVSARPFINDWDTLKNPNYRGHDGNIRCSRSVNCRSDGDKIRNMGVISGYRNLSPFRQGYGFHLNDYVMV